MTREELQETYAKLSMQELLEIIDKKFDYTELAVSVAFHEIARRNITEKEIMDYKLGQIEKVVGLIKQNIFNDLNLFQKNFFFFIWVPLFNLPMRQNFLEDGDILKLKQANYYSLFGFVSFILAGMISGIYDVSILTTIAILVLSFLPAYACDEFFNRQRQIKSLQLIFGRNKLQEAQEEHGLISIDGSNESVAQSSERTSE